MRGDGALKPARPGNHPALLFCAAPGCPARQDKRNGCNKTPFGKDSGR
jgi:hypothetical protein